MTGGYRKCADGAAGLRHIFRTLEIKRACYYFRSSKPLCIGGVDGTRTRDPRRDRPVPKVNIHAPWSAISSFKVLRNFSNFPS